MSCPEMFQGFGQMSSIVRVKWETSMVGHFQNELINKLLDEPKID